MSWSFASNMEIPELPSGITAIRLDWSAVGADEENLKPDDAVIAAVEALTLDPSNSPSKNNSYNREGNI